MSTTMTPDNVDEACRIASWYFSNHYGARFVRRHVGSQRDAVQEAMLFMLEYPPGPEVDIRFTTSVVNACRWSAARWARSGVADHARAAKHVTPLAIGDDRLTAVRRRESIAHARHLTAELLAQLSHRHRVLLKLRFGIGCPPRTLRQIGSRWGRTRERIRQIECAALRNLRELAAELPDRTRDDVR